jgi:hypothetical protein
LTACRSALIRGLQSAASQIAINEKGYVRDAASNLINGVRMVDFEADLAQGDGNELAGKFRAAHSSSALAVNSFAPFKAALPDLRLPGGADFSRLCFERKCHHGLAGRRSPNLDVFAESPDRIVAIESKCLEPLTPHPAKFSPVYDAEIRDARRASAWFAQMQRLVENPQTYRWLDAAQLVKHAFGLAYSFPDRATTLLYLYWEPANRDAHPFFAEHRAEIDCFAESVASATPAFASMSYPDLWRSWSALSQPAWLRTHGARLHARYGVAF